MSVPPSKTPAVSPVLDPICRAAALLVPLAVTALRVASAPQWRDDVAVVTSLGFVPFGGEGGLSALAAQLLSLVPIGGRVLRAGLVGALGTGLAAWSLYGIALSLLGRAARTPRLAPLLALSASLTATLSPLFQQEGTTAGGASLAVGLVLLGLSREAPEGTHGSVADAISSGALLGFVLAERRIAGAALLAMMCLGGLLRGAVPTRRSVLAFAVATTACWGFWLLPLVMRPLADHAWVNLGADLAVRTSLTPEAALEYRGPLSSWAADMGPLALALGLAGFVLGAVSRAVRAAMAPLAAVVVVSLVAPHPIPGVLTADPMASLDLLATAALSASAVLGVQMAVVLLRRFGVPFAEPAGVLLVVFHFTLVFIAAEQTADVVTPESALGADVWTDEALSELPPNALVLVRSPALAFRLWSSRIARGIRPDVVVVPLALLDRGSVARRVLEEEPATAALIRDVAMTGKTSEYALAELADTRPVFAELDPEWDSRLFTHLRPTPLWLGFVPHTLGRSDRSSALADADGRRAFSRVLAVARSVPGGDAATLTMLGAREREKAVVLAALGDRESLRQVAHDLHRIEPGSPFARGLEEQLEGKGRVDLRKLLR